MTYEEALEKALEALALGLITSDQVDSYVEHLLQKHGNSK